MRLLGETGREDDGENDNLMGARVPAANANAIRILQPIDPDRLQTADWPADRSESVYDFTKQY